jgi:hypothetical protein
MKHAVLPSKIWSPCSEIWPDFAKSGSCAKSEIWLFLLSFNGLGRCFQISDGGLQNLLRNLEILNEISDLCQISDFRKSTPKGVGDLPAVGGGGHHLPLGNLLGPKFWPESNPTTAAYTAKHMTAVVFHLSSQPEEETTHG